MAKHAVKVFEIIEGPVPNGGYRIQVRFDGNYVREFVGANITDALAKFRMAGYRMGHDTAVGFDYELP